MSDSTSARTDRSIARSIGLFVVTAVILRVWYVAEQLRSHHASSMSSTWVDAHGNTHTISLSTAPGRPFSEFLVEFKVDLCDAQREFPRKP